MHPSHETAAQRAERIANRAEYAAELATLDQLRPRVRGECGPTRRALVAHLQPGDPYREAAPCPFVSCRYHLHVDIGADGAIEFRPDGHTSIAHTCALDLADRGGVRREEMPEIWGVSEDRTRFFEQRLRERLADRDDVIELGELAGLTDEALDGAFLGAPGHDEADDENSTLDTKTAHGFGAEADPADECHDDAAARWLAAAEKGL